MNSVLSRAGVNQVRTLVRETDRIARDQQTVKEQEGRAEQDEALENKEERRRKRMQARGDTAGRRLLGACERFPGEALSSSLPRCHATNPQSAGVSCTHSSTLGWERARFTRNVEPE